MIAKRNEFVKKTASQRTGRRGGRVCAGIRRGGRGDMEILILKRVWKNFGTWGEGRETERILISLENEEKTF